MKVPVYNMQGEKSGNIELPEEVFNVPMNADLLHQATRTLLSHRRRSLAHTKIRSEVRGGGRKPWQQKGTGRARHGSIRSPLWRGGGVTFGPRKEQRYARELPDAMRRKAFAVVLSQKLRDRELMVLDAFRLPEAKTKYMAKVLEQLVRNTTGSTATKRRPAVTIALAQADDVVTRATRNIPHAYTSLAHDLDILDLLSSRYVFFPKDAVAVFAQRVSRKTKQPRKATKKL